MQPYTQQCQKLLGITGLLMYPMPGLDALFPIAFHRLGRQGDDRKRPEFGELSDAAHRVVSIHVGIMISIRTTSTSGSAWQHLNGAPAVSADFTTILCGSSKLVMAKILRVRHRR